VSRTLALVGLFVFTFSASAETPEVPPHPLTPAVAADKQASEFIAQFPVIRVAITSGRSGRGSGNGHQAYAFVAMKRLRELGFQGKFEVFYEPDEKSKLEFLLPKDDSRIVVSEWKKKTDEYGTARLDAGGKRVALGITGGDDLEVTPAQLNVDGLIRLQPSGWSSPGTVAIDEPGKVAHLPLLMRLPTRIRPLKIDRPGEFLEKEMGGSAVFKDKIRGIQTLMENSGRVETLAAYGLGYYDGPKKLANLVAAIQMSAKKPVVVPLLSSFNQQEWEDFEARLDEFPQGRPNVKVQGVQEAGVGDSIHALKPGEILVMPVGKLPQNVWNAMLNLSTLPPTVAGKTGLNFAMNRGRPYLDTTASSPVQLRNRAAIESVEAAQEALKTETAEMGAESVPMRALADYLVRSMESESRVSQAFAQAAQDQSHQPDKVSASLNEAAVQFEAWLLTASSPSSRLAPANCLRTLMENLND
jgi:hypothetical protein